MILIKIKSVVPNPEYGLTPEPQVSSKEASFEVKDVRLLVDKAQFTYIDLPEWKINENYMFTDISWNENKAIVQAQGVLLGGEIAEMGRIWEGIEIDIKTNFSHPWVDSRRFLIEYHPVPAKILCPGCDSLVSTSYMHSEECPVCDTILIEYERYKED